MRGSVLIVDDHEAISAIVAEVLRDEGFAVFELSGVEPATIHAEVARVQPNVVLLDGGDALGYGQSWDTAACLRARNPPIPVIMFTAHDGEVVEAELRLSERSRRAALAGFVLKPFDLAALIETVARVVEDPFARGPLASAG